MIYFYFREENLLEFQYAIDKHLPVNICTKPKKENILGPNRAELELQAMIFLCSVTDINTFIVLNGITL